MRLCPGNPDEKFSVLPGQFLNQLGELINQFQDNYYDLDIMNVGTSVVVYQEETI